MSSTIDPSRTASDNDQRRRESSSTPRPTESSPAMARSGTNPWETIQLSQHPNTPLIFNRNFTTTFLPPSCAVMGSPDSQGELSSYGFNLSPPPQAKAADPAEFQTICGFLDSSIPVEEIERDGVAIRVSRANEGVYIRPQTEDPGWTIRDRSGLAVPMDKVHFYPGYESAGERRREGASIRGRQVAAQKRLNLEWIDAMVQWRKSQRVGQLNMIIEEVKRGNWRIFRPGFNPNIHLAIARDFVDQENAREGRPVYEGGYPAEYTGQVCVCRYTLRMDPTLLQRLVDAVGARHGCSDEDIKDRECIVAHQGQGEQTDQEMADRSRLRAAALKNVVVKDFAFWARELLKMIRAGPQQQLVMAYGVVVHRNVLVEDEMHRLTQIAMMAQQHRSTVLPRSEVARDLRGGANERVVDLMCKILSDPLASVFELHAYTHGVFKPGPVCDAVLFSHLYRQVVRAGEAQEPGE